MVLFIMLYKVVLTFESVDEILKCDHLNKSYWEVLSCGTVKHATEQYFLIPYLLCCTRWFYRLSVKL